MQLELGMPPTGHNAPRKSFPTTEPPMKCFRIYCAGMTVYARALNRQKAKWAVARAVRMAGFEPFHDLSVGTGGAKPCATECCPSRKWDGTPTDCIWATTTPADSDRILQRNKDDEYA